MGINITGFSTPFGGMSWEKTEGDRQLAREVITFLEDRRLLFGHRHSEDEVYCVRSANEIRQFLTAKLSEAKPGKELEASLRSMRGACRRFMEAAGPDGRYLHGIGRHYQEADPFSLALGDLRTSIGFVIAAILSQYPMPIESGLASILPPLDID